MASKITIKWYSLAKKLFFEPVLILLSLLIIIMIIIFHFLGIIKNMSMHTTHPLSA